MSCSDRRPPHPSKRGAWIANASILVCGLIGSISSEARTGSPTVIIGVRSAEGASGVLGPVGAAGVVGLGERGALIDGACSWSTPVDAPIIDNFRAPPDPFGPGGNRGIEYDTSPGQPVSSVAVGRVTFVGPVGGRRWLVITHEDGLRSTYGPLLASSVVRGQSVAGGDVIATADRGLHLTARAGDRYLDPEPLLQGTCGHPRLVAAQGEAGDGRLAPD